MRIIIHIWPLSCNETVLENYAFLVYVYYTHPGYQTSICGKNRAYYIRIFPVCSIQSVELAQLQKDVHNHCNDRMVDRASATFSSHPVHTEAYMSAWPRFLSRLLKASIIYAVFESITVNCHHRKPWNATRIPGFTVTY